MIAQACVKVAAYLIVTMVRGTVTGAVAERNVHFLDYILMASR